MLELGYPADGSFEAFLPRFRSFLERAVGSGRWHVWLAEDVDGAVLGSVYLQTIEVVPRPSVPPKGPWGYLTTFFVIPEARERGVGTRLLDALLAEARRQGLRRVQVWPSERSASLYRRFGWTESPDALELDLIGDEPG
jgi:GNAT superfamily N-acetyltransferase